MSREKVHFQSNKSSNWGKVVSQRSEQTKLKAVSRHKFLTAQLYLGHANFSSYSPLVECRGFIPAEVVKDVGLRNKFKAPLGAVGRALLRLNFIPNFSKRAGKKEGHRFPFFFPSIFCLATGFVLYLTVRLTRNSSLRTLLIDLQQFHSISCELSQRFETANLLYNSQITRGSFKVNNLS